MKETLLNWQHPCQHEFIMSLRGELEKKNTFMRIKAEIGKHLKFNHQIQR